MRKFLWSCCPPGPRWLRRAAARAGAARRGVPAAARPAAPAAAARGLDGRRFAALEVRVYRDGPMQKLGHDHLITSDGLVGTIALREPLTETRFELRVPLESLVVDDVAARAAAGGDLRGAGAAEGPRRDAPQHAGREAARRRTPGRDAPHARIDYRRARQLRGARARLARRPREAWSSRRSPSRSTATVSSAHAEFHLTHADLGLVPFTVALGALRVRDDFEVDLTLEARRGS